jgi:hypothetical protein
MAHALRFQFNGVALTSVGSAVTPIAAGAKAPPAPVGVAAAASGLESLSKSGTDNGCLKWLRSTWHSTLACCCPGSNSDDVRAHARAGTGPERRDGFNLLLEGETPRAPSPVSRLAPAAPSAGSVAAVGAEAAPAVAMVALPAVAENGRGVGHELIAALGAPIAPPATENGAGVSQALIAALGAPVAPPAVEPLPKPISFLAAPLSVELVEQIDYVLDNLAKGQGGWGPFIALGKFAVPMKAKGEAIEAALHPFEFFAYLVTKKMEQLRVVGDKSKGLTIPTRFVTDWGKHLNRRENLDGYLIAFYEHVQVQPEHRVELSKFFQNRNWAGFFDYCLQNDLTRSK